MLSEKMNVVAGNRHWRLCMVVEMSKASTRRSVTAKRLSRSSEEVDGRPRRERIGFFL